MALAYGPFDGSGPGSSITEAFWIKMARTWLRTGVVRGELSEFSVFADSTGMQVRVSDGFAWVEGQGCLNDALVTLPVTAANATNPRIDRVVLRKDNTAKTFTLLVLAGTPATSPSPPALTQSASLWDLPLAQVLVPAAATTITAANVTDERSLVRNVDVTRVEVLENKTLIKPTIADFTNAQHSHASAQGGGALNFKRFAMVGVPAFTPAASNGATLAFVNDSYELQFPDGVARMAYCRDALWVPPSYTGTPITIWVLAYSTAAAQNFMVQAYAAAGGPGAPPNPALAVVDGGVVTTNGAAGMQTFWGFVWNSNLPQPTVDLQIALRRDPTAAGDTSADTLRIRKVLIDFGS